MIRLSEGRHPPSIADRDQPEPPGPPNTLLGLTVAVSGLVAGPFAIYKAPHANGFVLIHLPSQAKIIDLEMQNCCKDAAEKFAALDLNWWTCIPEEVIGPDLQEMRNIHTRLKPTSWIARLGQEGSGDGRA